MGVPDPLVHVFKRNTNYDPWEQTLLVGELANMTGVKHRKIFIDAATAADEESVVVFQRARAQLMGHDFYEMFKVALCNQVEDPRLAKGIVMREVVRVYTPGLVGRRPGKISEY